MPLAMLLIICIHLAEPHDLVGLPSNHDSPSSVPRSLLSTLVAHHPDMFLSEIYPRLDSRTCLRLLAVDRQLCALTADDCLADLRRSVLASYRPDPGLPSRVQSLAYLERHPNVTTSVRVESGEVCLLLDRLRSLPPDQLQSALQGCGALIGDADRRFSQLRQCRKNGRRGRRPTQVRWALGADLRHYLQELLHAPLGAMTWIDEGDLIERLQRGGRAALVTHPPTLRRLLELGGRFHLEQVLYRLPVRGPALDAALPFYDSVWAGTGGDRLNWPFLRALTLLADRRSATSLDAFWRLAPVVQHYADRWPDLLDGIDSIERLRLLDAIQFPFADGMLAGAGRVRHLYRTAIGAYQLDFDLLQFLLVNSTSSVHRYGAGLGLHDLIGIRSRGRSLLDQLRWTAIERHKHSHRALLEAALEAAPPATLWRATAFRLLSEPLSVVVDGSYLLEALRARLPSFRPFPSDRLREWLPPVPMAGVRLRLMDHLERLGVAAPSQASLLRLVALVQRHGQLTEIVNERNPLDGNTLLHFAICHHSAAMIDLLLSVPGIDVTIRNEAGHLAFDYVSFWSVWVGDDSRHNCVEAIVRHLETVTASLPPVDGAERDG